MDLARRLIILLVPVFFLTGLWWGLKEFRSQKTVAIQYSKSLNVLLPKGLINKPTQRRIERQNEIGLNLIEAESPKDLLYRLKDSTQSYDLIFAISDQVTFAGLGDIFTDLPPEKNKLIESLHSDFTWNPVDPEMQYTIPFFWYLEGVYVQKKFLEEKKLGTDFSWKDLYGQLDKDHQLIMPRHSKSLLDFLLQAEQLEEKWLNLSQPDFARKPLREALERIQIKEGFNIESPAEEVVAILSAENTQLSAKEDWQFILPKNKSNLREILVGIARETIYPQKAFGVMQSLSDVKTNYGITQFSQFSSTIKAMVDSDLPAHKKPTALRKYPLPRVNHSVTQNTELLGWERMLDSIIEEKKAN